MEPILLDEPPFETKPINGTLFDISAAARKGKTETVGTIPKNVTKNSEIFDYLRKKSSKRRQRHAHGHSYQITDHPNYGTQFVKLSPDKDPEADKTISLDESLKSSLNLPSSASLLDSSRNRLVISRFLTLGDNFVFMRVQKFQKWRFKQSPCPSLLFR